jgi:Beta protein
MYPVQKQFYSVTLREKGGELKGLRLLDETSKNFLLPNLIALPLSEKENAKLTIEALIKREVGKVLQNWGTRVCLWDPRFLKFDEEDVIKDGIWLERLVGQFQRYGARVIPVVGLREEIHRTSAIASYARRANSGIAIRVDFDDIQEYELLDVALTNLRTRPEECILIVDITDADISEHDEFAKSLIGWLFALKDRGNWEKHFIWL